MRRTGERGEDAFEPVALLIRTPAIVGANPDNVAWTPGGKVLVANEGEPTDSGDPEGSISVVDVYNCSAETADFNDFNGQATQLRASGVRLFPDVEPEQASPASTRAPESDLIEPLSERELQVLELIAKGLTNPEIASRLYVSLHTIKAHAQHIYGKLGVHSRTQAVARARAFGILPST